MVVVVRLVVIERDTPGCARPLTVTMLPRVTVPETTTVASTVGVGDLTPRLDLFVPRGVDVAITATGAGLPTVVGAPAGLMGAVATTLGTAAVAVAMAVALGATVLVAVGVLVSVFVGAVVAVVVAVGVGAVVLVAAGSMVAVLMGAGGYGRVAVATGTVVLVGEGMAVATLAAVGVGADVLALVAVGMAVAWQGNPHVTAGAVLDGVGVAPAPGIIDGTVGVADGTGVALDGGVAVGAGPALFQSVARLARFGEPHPVASSQFGPAG